MKCKKCNKEHDGSFGSGKYCSKSCANSRVRTDEVKKKISEGILKSEWWVSKDFSHNSNPEKIEKNKETVRWNSLIAVLQVLNIKLEFKSPLTK